MEEKLFEFTLANHIYTFEKFYQIIHLNSALRIKKFFFRKKVCLLYPSFLQLVIFEIIKDSTIDPHSRAKNFFSPLGTAVFREGREQFRVGFHKIAMIRPWKRELWRVGSR